MIWFKEILKAQVTWHIPCQWFFYIQKMTWEANTNWMKKKNKCSFLLQAILTFILVDKRITVASLAKTFVQGSFETTHETKHKV